jgi:FMN reductase
MTRIVVLSGSLNKPSRTRAVLETIAQRIAPRLHAEVAVVDIAELAPELGAAVTFDKLPTAVVEAQRLLASADLLVVGSPVYKGSYSGLFKHFLDLLEPTRLSGKVAILAATGGSDRHALVLEHQFRPLLSFFEINTVPAGVYVSDSELDGPRLKDPSGAASRRIDLAVEQALRLLPVPVRLALAA